ncbi:10633_t:CDS:2 [Entrophospora sp. SA101]|nr:14314_t:CDS:2 [Entrophospora sp. SA101]CAJ0752190.1 10633_t:CDS:2 [Entrophospora sp. SA101]CAJ0889744.1 12707_t:CDS:2 [Entrophospora sp. SA101]
MYAESAKDTYLDKSSDSLLRVTGFMIDPHNFVVETQTEQQ